MSFFFPKRDLRILLTGVSGCAGAVQPAPGGMPDAVILGYPFLKSYFSRWRYHWISHNSTTGENTEYLPFIEFGPYENPDVDDVSPELEVEIEENR